jgi:hypothetical protein
VKTLDFSPGSSVIGGGSISSDTDTGVFGTAAGNISTEGALTRGGRNTPSTAAEAIHGSQRSTITAAGSVRAAAAVPGSEGAEFGAQPCIVADKVVHDTPSGRMSPKMGRRQSFKGNIRLPATEVSENPKKTRSALGQKRAAQSSSRPAVRAAKPPREGPVQAPLVTRPAN